MSQKKSNFKCNQYCKDPIKVIFAFFQNIVVFMRFILFIHVKMPTIVANLTFISSTECFNQMKSLFFSF